MIDPKKFVMFLKFLKFINSLDYKTEIFDGDSYRLILFRVKDFLDVSHSQDPATNAAAGGTIASFIGHMKSVIEKSKNNNSTRGLVFTNPAILSKYTNDELIALNVVILGGVLIIIISYYVIPRIAKAYWNYSKKLMDKLISKRKKHFSINAFFYRS